MNIPKSRRPTAFEISFPGETQSTGGSDSAVSVKSEGKRKNDAPTLVPPRDIKRPRSAARPRPCYYVPKPTEVLESGELMVTGEYEDVDDSKPVRILSRFTIFDTKKDMEMVSLSIMDEHDGKDKRFEGAGTVKGLEASEEDEGQLDDHPQYVRLSPILGYSVDYSKADDAIYVETAHAFYFLESAARPYKPFFGPFQKSHRIAQLVISSALSRTPLSYDKFLRKFLSTADTQSGGHYKEADLNDAKPTIAKAVGEQANASTLVKVPFLRHLLRDCMPNVASGRLRQPRSIRHIHNLHTLLKSSLDLAVLRPENQNPTQVTPLINKLATGWFRERLDVIGNRPRTPDEALEKRQKKETADRLRLLIQRAWRSRRNISFNNDQRKGRTDWFRSVVIDGETYNIGDTVLVQMGCNGKNPPPPLPDPRAIPPTATIYEHFWFAKIIYINREHETAHVQWFWHSSTTAMQELFDPQELFLAELCDMIDLNCVVGKAAVQYFDPANDTELKVKHGDFFYKFVYDSDTSAYLDVDHQRIETANSGEPPDNCPVCLLVEQRNDGSFWRRIPGGISYLGKVYHVHDFVLIRTTGGPCEIGQISDIRLQAKFHRHDSPKIFVKLLGRISNLDIRPEHVVKDEQHLFSTDEEVQIKKEDLIRVCYVFPHRTLGDSVDFVMSQFPDHFYIKYHFPTLEPTSWNDKQLVNLDLSVCFACCGEKLEELRLMREFLSYATQQPLRALDLFGGVGAFGLGMEEAGWMKVTHAIEIAPSAAKTFKRNSPDTIVYNDCVNTILRYAVKTHHGHQVEVPLSKYDETPAPPPPLPDTIEVLLAGFPCQSHSDLNMFKKADDPKSALILPTLSWVDFLKPKFCVFENVRGFLRYNLNATQAGKYRVEGGIPMGGLKFLLRALVSMDYQVRYGLLQAGHYGTPQTRVRFFLVAAHSGCPLPQLPQPTHSFPLFDPLTVKLPIDEIIRPIRTTEGTAPYPFVNIDDAIGDLPRFDWKNPTLHRESQAKQREARERQRTIPALVCKKSDPHCGYAGAIPYHHQPKTMYQVRSRKVPTRDLQHYTRCLIQKKVERVVTIPLVPLADYRSLRPDQYEWQLANPSSAVAKGGFKAGYYGRLDQNRWFWTTVTNVDPTAKQSKVLHPYCKRILTVRELARSQGFPDHFVFESINNNVVTLHRQIGNAVPWLVSVAIGKEIRKALFEMWLRARDQQAANSSR